MHAYRSKYGKLPGTSHARAVQAARHEYHKIQKRTPRRQAHVRSRYFRNDKVFINQFWEHIKQKHPGDQVRRLRLYLCAIDVIRNSTTSPNTIFNKADLNIILHRFEGKTKDGEPFYVQVKENKRTNRKDFMSVFPGKNSK